MGRFEELRKGLLTRSRHFLNAYTKLVVVAERLNKGWTPDWANPEEEKWVIGSDHTPIRVDSPQVGTVPFQTEKLALRAIKILGNSIGRLLMEKREDDFDIPEDMMSEYLRSKMSSLADLYNKKAGWTPEDGAEKWTLNSFGSPVIDTGKVSRDKIYFCSEEVANECIDSFDPGDIKLIIS